MRLLETKGLSKSYDGREVVKGVDIVIKRGAIIGDVLVSGVVPRDTDFVVPLAKLDGLRV